MSSVRLNAKFATALRRKGLKGKEGNGGTTKARWARRLEDGGFFLQKVTRGTELGLCCFLITIYQIRGTSS